MGSGSEVHRLIWYGNLFLSKLMRGACKWESHSLLGFAASHCHPLSSGLEARLLQGHGSQGCLRSWVTLGLGSSSVRWEE